MFLREFIQHVLPLKRDQITFFQCYQNIIDGKNEEETINLWCGSEKTINQIMKLINKKINPFNCQCQTIFNITKHYNLNIYNMCIPISDKQSKEQFKTPNNVLYFHNIPRYYNSNKNVGLLKELCSNDIIQLRPTYPHYPHYIDKSVSRYTHKMPIVILHIDNFHDYSLIANDMPFWRRVVPLKFHKTNFKLDISSMGNSNCKLDFLDRELQLEKSSKSSRSLSYETKMKYLYYLVHNFIQQNLHSSHSSNRTIMLNELKNINNKKNLYNLKNNVHHSLNCIVFHNLYSFYKHRCFLNNFRQDLQKNVYHYFENIYLTLKYYYITKITNKYCIPLEFNVQIMKCLTEL